MSNFSGYLPNYGGVLPNYGAAPDYLAHLRGAQMPVQGQNMQPMQQTQPMMNAPQAQTGTPIWVQGEAGAKSYMVAPGNTVMLMDSEDQVFYIKAADQSGMPLPLRVFDYKERVGSFPTTAQNAAQGSNAFDPSNYITRQEFEQWKASLAPAVAPAAAPVRGNVNDIDKEDVTNG